MVYYDIREVNTNINFSGIGYEEYVLYIDNIYKARIVINKTEKLVCYYEQYVDRLTLYEIVKLLELLARDYNSNHIKIQFEEVDYSIAQYLVRINNIELGNMWLSQDLCFIKLMGIDNERFAVNIDVVAEHTLQIIDVHRKQCNPQVQDDKYVSHMLDSIKSNLGAEGYKYKIISQNDDIIRGLINRIEIKDSVTDGNRRFECFDIDDRMIIGFNAYKSDKDRHILLNVETIPQGFRETANRLINYQLITENFMDENFTDKDLAKLLQPLGYNYNTVDRIKVTNFANCEGDFLLYLEVYSNEYEGNLTLELKNAKVVSYQDDYCCEVGLQLLNILSLTKNKTGIVSTH